jgi:uncharacterized metal-binding protein
MKVFLYFLLVFLLSAIPENMKPIIYACAGCSGAGQIAYKLALKMDREQLAEMSCLAGLASGKKTFTSKIKNRPIWIIDGCAIECAKTILKNMGIKEAKHIQLHKFDIKKNQDPDKDINLDHLQIRANHE